MSMEFQSVHITNIKDIKVETEPININVTLVSRNKVKSWTKKKSSGKLLSGVLGDDTGLIDFVAWSEIAERLDTTLINNSTMVIKKLKVNSAKSQYSTTQHPCQVVFDKNTVIELIECVPHITPLKVTPISDLKTKQDHEKVTVIGKVISMPPIEKLNNTSETKILKSKIQDNTGTIQLSLIGENEINNCNYSVNDVVLLRNIVLRVYGQLRCLQGNTGIRGVNPTDRDYSMYLPSANTLCEDLSPDKMTPKKVMLSQLNEEGRQQVDTTVLSSNLKDAIYDRCPSVRCRSRVVCLDNGLYRCNKCEVDSIVSTNGIRLELYFNTNEKKDSRDKGKVIILFNDVAEKFLQTSVKSLSNLTDQEVEKFEKQFLNTRYEFIVIPGRTKDEFLCQSATKLEKDLLQKYDAMSACTMLSMDKDTAYMKTPQTFTQKDVSQSFVNIITNSTPIHAYKGVSTPKSVRCVPATGTHTPYAAGCSSSTNDDIPLNLSITDVNQSDHGHDTFDLDIYDSNNNKEDDSQPLDLSGHSSCSSRVEYMQGNIYKPPSKRFKFVKRLDFTDCD